MPDFGVSTNILKVLRQPSQKFLPKILTLYFLYNNFYLTFLRSCCENIYKIACRVSVSICLIRKSKSDGFLHEELLLDWLIFLLLEFVCCSKCFPKTTNLLLLNLFLHFLHPLVLKHLRIFVTVMQSNSTAFQLKFSTRVTYKIISLVLSCGFQLARFSILEINS